MRRLWTLMLGVALAVAAAGEARAHASLRARLPADGALLREPPERIELQFSEPVVALAMRLETSAGEAVPVAIESSRDGARLELRPQRPLGEGSWVVHWRVASVDGHPVAGRSAFAVGATTLPAPASAEADPGSRPLAPVAARFLYLATTLAGAGGALALLLLPLGPRAFLASRRFARAALAASLAAALSRLATSGLEATGLPAAALLTAAPWQASSSLSLAPALAVSAAGSCLLLAGLARRGATPPAPAAVFPGVLLTAAGFGLTGHTATASPAILFGPLLALHVLPAAFWLGSLLPLAATLRLDPQSVAVSVLERFSQLAVRAVPMLLLIGLTLAARQLPEPSALWTSAWGRLLLAKLALLAGLLAVAAINRLRLVPRLARGDRDASVPLLRLLGFDVGLALLLLAATAGLGSTPPPRLIEPPALLAVSLEGDGLRARLALSPGAAGWNRLAVELDPPSPPPLEITLTLVPEGSADAPLHAVAHADEGGVYRTGPLLLVPAGAWRIVLGVLVDPFTRHELSGRIPLDRDADFGTNPKETSR